MHQHSCCLIFHQLTRNNLHVSLPCTQTLRNHRGSTHIFEKVNQLPPWSSVSKPPLPRIARVQTRHWMVERVVDGLERQRFLWTPTMASGSRSPDLKRRVREVSWLWRFLVFIFHNNEWFNGALSMKQAPHGIAYKELFPIVLASVLWGSQWQQQRVQFQCDNENVVAVLRTGSSRDANMMQLIRQLFSGNSSL